MKCTNQDRYEQAQVYRALLKELVKDAAACHPPLLMLFPPRLYEAQDQ
jgi:hypothetical protein